MRKFLLYLLVGVVGIVFLGRLMYLQIINPEFGTISERNAVKTEFVYPQRGFIYDRTGKLMVSNQPIYNVMVTPRDVSPFDTLQFAKLLRISPENLELRLAKARNYSPFLPSILVSQVSKSDYAYLQEKMRNFPGFFIQKNYIRDYHVHDAANVLGYISQVNPWELEHLKGYRRGDLIGRSGVEKQYERILRGKKGVKYFQKDRFNRKIGPYQEGKYDTLPVNGKNITLTIDQELQKYGEELMVHKRGAIVAIEPKSGEILSLVSAPSYDPGLLVGRDRSKNFNKLWYDTINKPLFDRALLATYSPGSTFKTVEAAIALQEGVIDLQSRISCHNGFYYGRHGHMNCESHPSPLNVEGALAYSCNTFFAKAYWWMIDNYATPQEGMDRWHDHLAKFGLGDFLGYDLPTGRKGLIPTSDLYNRTYNYPKYHWSATYTLSNGIGQGEVLVTPIQLANMVAAIANRGWFYTPHVLKKIDGVPIRDTTYTKKHDTGVAERNFEPVVEGMKRVYKKGTGRFVQIPGVEAAGKTGTAENYIRIKGKRIQLTDHSLFVAFAPADDPKIAVSVMVENGRWGARYAAKIASLMMEKYLKGHIERKDLETWILSHSLEEEYSKPYLKEGFKINQ